MDFFDYFKRERGGVGEFYALECADCKGKEIREVFSFFFSVLINKSHI